MVLILKERNERMREQFDAWAIDTQSAEGHGLLGRYFWNETIPPSIEGCKKALFVTRQLARDYRRKAFQNYCPEDWKPRVIRVHVTIEEIECRTYSESKG